MYFGHGMATMEFDSRTVAIQTSIACHIKVSVSYKSDVTIWNRLQRTGPGSDKVKACLVLGLHLSNLRDWQLLCNISNK